MRIAQIAPLYESVPPKLYGGTERIVSYLTEELVRQGHEVTLFASGDSQTSAKLVGCCNTALRLNPLVMDAVPYHVIMLEEVRQRRDKFDILHFHIDFLHAPLVRDLAHRTLTTLHGRLDLPDLPAFYRVFSELPLVSISSDQRGYLPDANWIGTVPHGIPADLLPFRPNPTGRYLAFLGRISPEKRPDRAIEIARQTGLPLKIAAKVDRADQEYYEGLIRPLIASNPLVEYIGEISDVEKSDFLSGAMGLLVPIDWPEPFGLVMIESMACGTPVIAFNRGSVAEIVEDGLTGFIVEDETSAVADVERLSALDRSAIRRRFEARFTARRMALDYLAAYRSLMGAAGPRIKLVSSAE